MGYKTKIQLIKRKNSEQWYVNFPYQVAQVMEFKRGEEFKWSLLDKNSLKLKRSKKWVVMSLPIKEIPATVKKLLTHYKKHFTRPQYQNFRDFILGLIVSDKKKYPRNRWLLWKGWPKQLKSFSYIVWMEWEED